MFSQLVTKATVTWSKRANASGVTYKNFINRNCSESLASPSTTSTTSLAQLRYKLAAVEPRNNFIKNFKSEKEDGRTRLSSVIEISETGDIDSLHSKTSHVFRQSDVDIANRQTKKKAERYSDLLKQKQDIQPSRREPVTSNELSASCLLVTTLGNDESVINDTLERISKNNDFQTRNIVDLLVQEAFEAEIVRDKQKDSGINTDEKETQDNEENSEAIENTPIEDNVLNVTRKITITKKKPCTIVSKSTTDDESNTEAIIETPVFVNPRRSKLSSKAGILKVSELKKTKNSLSAQNVEDFFSQHITKAKTGGIEISPTLVRKVNVSSSNTSKSFDENCLDVNYDINADVDQFEIIDIDVEKCLNYILDKVCNDFDKVCNDLFQDLSIKGNHTQEDKKHDNFVNNQTKKTNKGRTKMPKVKTKPVSKPKKNIKLTFNTDKDEKPKSVAKKNKTTKNKSPKKMSTINKRNDEEILGICSPKLNIEHAEVAKMNNPIINTKDKESPTAEKNIAKRKRKLYSPKDEEINKERKETQLSDSEDDNINLAAIKDRDKTETPKTTATCYKELEIERKRYIRLPQFRKSHNRCAKSFSPTTLNDDVFDKIRSTVENETHCILVDPKSTDEVYNFSSSSEDPDFDVKKIAIRKRVNANKVVSSESSVSAKPGKQNVCRHNIEKSTNVKPKKTKQVRKKTATKRTNKRKVGINTKSIIDLDEERMRSGAPEVLDTSLINAKAKDIKPVNVDFISDYPPQMELIADDKEFTSEPKTKRKKLNKNTTSDSDSGTSSPLPGLIIETVSERKDEMIDLSVAQFKLELQKIQQAEFEKKENVAPRAESDVLKNVTKDYDKINKIEDKVQNENISNNKVMEIPDTFHIHSDKSVSSNGICAHFNSDDHSLSPGLLDRSISPREVYDMPESMKSCFVRLNHVLCGPISKEQSDISKEDNTRLVSQNSSRISAADPPISSVDIRKMVKSRLTSDSSSGPSNRQDFLKHEQKVKVSNQFETPKSIPVHSPKEKLPIVSIVPLSLEEIDRWSKPSLKSGDQSPTAVSSKNEGSSPKFVFNTRKKVLKNVTISDNETSDTEFKETEKYKGARRKNSNASNTNGSTATSPYKRKSSIISPINIVWIPRNEKPDQSPPRKVSKDRVRHKAKLRAVETLQISPNPGTSSIELASQEPGKVLSKSNPAEIMDGTSERATKRLNVEDSTVQDWLKKNYAEQDINRLGPIVDILKNVMEKLDTCLVESNKNTSKKFVDILMEVQTHIQNQRTELIRTVIQTYDDTTESFLEELQKNVTNVILQDRKQKELLETTLRDEIQAALDLIECMKSKRSKHPKE